MARDVTKLHPDLQELVEKLKTECTKKGLKIGISECVRTVAEQDKLYSYGRTDMSRGKVTNARGSSYSSMHQWGVAFDFYRNDGKGAYYDKDGFFRKVGQVGKSIGLEWGGDWKSIIDQPHFQLPNWGSTASQLKKLYGTPTKFMATWKKAKPVEKPKKGMSSTNNWVERLQKEIGANPDNIAGPKTLAATPTLEKGSKGNVVGLVQERLISFGYDLGKWGPNKDGIDKSFGGTMKTVVKQYQREKLGHKKPDGIITSGKSTWKGLLGL